MFFFPAARRCNVLSSLNDDERPPRIEDQEVQEEGLEDDAVDLVIDARRVQNEWFSCGGLMVVNGGLVVVTNRN